MIYVMSTNQINEISTNVVFMPYDILTLPITVAGNILGHIDRLYAAGFTVKEERDMPQQKLTMLFFKRDTVNIEGDNGIVKTLIVDKT